MCIIIKQGAVACLQTHKRRKMNQNGFTLPEVLVSLCILLMLLYGVWQWGIVMQGSVDRMEENDKAVYLAQQIVYGAKPVYPENWQVIVHKNIQSELLEETYITIHTGRRSWEFYYAGPANRGA